MEEEAEEEEPVDPEKEKQIMVKLEESADRLSQKAEEIRKRITECIDELNESIKENAPYKIKSCLKRLTFLKGQEDAVNSMVTMSASTVNSIKSSIIKSFESNSKPESQGSITHLKTVEYQIEAIKKSMEKQRLLLLTGFITVNDKLDNIKEDTESIKQYTALIEDIIDKIDNLEEFLFDRLGSDFQKIRKAWEDYKGGSISKKELIGEGIKIIGKKFVSIFLKKMF